MPSPVRYAEVRKMLEALGFFCVRTAGSHFVFKKVGEEKMFVIPVHKGLVKYGYVREIKIGRKGSKRSMKAAPSEISAAELARVRPAVKDYRFTMWFEDGEWWARGVEMPDALAEGKTPEACIGHVREVMEIIAATILAEGGKLPRAGRAEVRDVQVNVRLSQSERVVLEEKAREAGSRGVADYMRGVALRG